MSPLRGSLLGFIRVLQRCHPYGVEEEIGQKSGENLPYKRRQRSNAKNFTHPSFQSHSIVGFLGSFANEDALGNVWAGTRPAPTMKML